MGRGSAGMSDGTSSKVVVADCGEDNGVMTSGVGDGGCGISNGSSNGGEAR